MPRKTLALISGLVVVTVILFIIALKTGKQEMQPAPTPSVQPSPTSVAHSVLSFSPNPVTVQPGGQGSVAVTIDTSDNAVTAVQLEIAYDPSAVTNIKVTSGSLFASPTVLINKNDAKKGRYTYAFGITPNGKTVSGTGSVAAITFTAKGALGTQSQLTLLPTSLVTARGVASSVLKSATGTTVVIGSGGGAMQYTSPSVSPVNKY